MREGAAVWGQSAGDERAEDSRAVLLVTDANRATGQESRGMAGTHCEFLWGGRQVDPFKDAQGEVHVSVSFLP